MRTTDTLGQQSATDAPSRPAQPPVGPPTATLEREPGCVPEPTIGAPAQPDAAPGAPWPVSEQTMRDALGCLERIDGAVHAQLRFRRHDSERARRLRSQLPRMAVACDPRIAAVGRRITVGTERNQFRSWWLALPGDASATAETVSITSDIGRSLAWASPGDTVYLTGSGGAWAVVLEVTGPR